MYYEVIIDHIDQIMITFPCVHCVHYIDDLCNQIFIKLPSIGSLHCDQNNQSMKFGVIIFLIIRISKNKRNTVNIKRLREIMTRKKQTLLV